MDRPSGSLRRLVSSLVSLCSSGPPGTASSLGASALRRRLGTWLNTNARSWFRLFSAFGLRRCCFLRCSLLTLPARLLSQPARLSLFPSFCRLTAPQTFEGSALARLPRDWPRGATYKPTTVQSQVHRRVAMAQSIILGGGKRQVRGKASQIIENNTT